MLIGQKESFLVTLKNAIIIKVRLIIYKIYKLLRFKNFLDFLNIFKNGIYNTQI